LPVGPVGHGIKNPSPEIRIITITLGEKTSNQKFFPWQFSVEPIVVGEGDWVKDRALSENMARVKNTPCESARPG
jgi:hypothetical protein